MGLPAPGPWGKVPVASAAPCWTCLHVAPPSSQALPCAWPCRIPLGHAEVPGRPRRHVEENVDLVESDAAVASGPSLDGNDEAEECEDTPGIAIGLSERQAAHAVPLPAAHVYAERLVSDT